jgi:hypothetical protein
MTRIVSESVIECPSMVITVDQWQGYLEKLQIYIRTAELKKYILKL